MNYIGGRAGAGLGPKMYKLDLKLSRNAAACICNICLAVITEKVVGLVEPGETGLEWSAASEEERRWR